jgi:DNA-binding transcriptional ArsR family regulator
MKVEKISKAISDKNRIKILNYLIKGPQNVSSVSEKIDIEENLASHHLRILANLNMIKGTKKGREVIYTINRPKIISLVKDLIKNPFINEIVQEVISEKKKSTKTRN